VDDNSDYISISQESGFDLVNDLGIEVTKQKAASGIVVASVFSPLSSTSQLSFTAKRSGYNNRITELTETGAGNLALDSMGLNLGTTRTSYVQTEGGEDTPGFVYALSALNSKFNFNGVDIERDSNEVSDLVTGATISLKSVMEATDATVSVSVTNNVSSIKSKIESFITKFNEIYSYIRSKSTTDDAGNRGIFLGDTNASSILSMFSNSAYGVVAGIKSEDINTLSKLGITFSTSSGLSISDSAKLEQNLNEKIDEVENLFNSTNGIAATLYDKVSSYLGSSGYLTKAKKSVDDSIEEISDSISSKQEKIEKSSESLRQRYIEMQMQLNSLYEVYNSISSM
jgi:flagellar hook-associated protein 2